MRFASSAVSLLHQATSAEIRSRAGSQFLKCRAFQPVEIALARSRLLKDTQVRGLHLIEPEHHRRHTVHFTNGGCLNAESSSRSDEGLFSIRIKFRKGRATGRPEFYAFSVPLEKIAINRHSNRFGQMTVDIPVI